MVHHKAPHRSWEPAPATRTLYADTDHSGAADAARRPRRPARPPRSRRACGCGPHRDGPQGARPARADRGRGAGLALPALHQGLPALRGSPRRERHPPARRPRRRRDWPTTRSSSTPRTRASSSATTAGSTSASCTRNRCACRSSSAIRAWSRPARAAPRWSSTSTSPRPSSSWPASRRRADAGSLPAPLLRVASAGRLADEHVLPLLDAPRQLAWRAGPTAASAPIATSSSTTTASGLDQPGAADEPRSR